MRVLFIGPNLGAGGAERQLSILAPRLRELGFDARVIALDAGGPFVEPLRRRGVPVEVVGMRHQADLRRLVRCPLVRDFAPDVVVSRSVSGACVGQAVAGWRRARHVCNDHMQVGMTLPPRREAMMRLIAPRLDMVIGVAPEQGAIWQRRGCPADRFAVVANGVEAPEVAEGRDDLRRKLGIAPSAVVALLVANLRSEKRVPDFVEAVRRARSTRPELVGLIVGDGAERVAVERAIDGDPGVRWLGERDDVPRLMKASDLLVLSSAFEAAPMAILEAMASGLPVLATNVGGVSELVLDRVTGLLVAPSDPPAIAEQLAILAADPALRRALGDAGLERQRASWSAAAMVEGYAGILRRLAERPRSPRVRSTSFVSSKLRGCPRAPGA
ncbi:MAG: glycosyltransferase [Actinomycetota bacterium]|nr:glycosyltransferase [Actinomycetota bacterium]